MLAKASTLAKAYLDYNLIRLLKNSGWTFFGNLPVLALSLVRNVIVTRSLGLDSWGILTLVVATVTVINDIIDFRVWETVVKYMAADLAEKNTNRAAATLKYSIGIDVFAGLLAFIIVYLFAGMLNLLVVKSENGSFLLKIYAVYLLFSTIDPSATALLRVANRFDLISYIKIFSSIVLTLFTIIMLSIENSIENAIIAIVIGNGISSILSIYFCLREADQMLYKRWWRINVRTELSGRLKEMTSFTLQTNFLGTIKMIATRLDVLIIGAVAGPAQAGLYRLAANLGALLAQVTDPMYHAIFPDLSRIWTQRDIKGFTNLLRKSSLLASFVILPFASILFFFSPQIIGLLYGDEYLSASSSFRIILFGFVCATILFWSRPAILSMGMISIQTRIAASIITFQIAIILVLAPYLGASAGAIGLSFAYIGVNIMLAIIIWRRIRQISEANKPVT